MLVIILAARANSINLLFIYEGAAKEREAAGDSTPVGGIILLPPRHLLPRQQMKEIKAEQTAPPPPQRFISFRIRPEFFFSLQSIFKQEKKKIYKPHRVLILILFFCLYRRGMYMKAILSFYVILALWHCSGTMEEEEKCTLESFSSLVCNS
jgi:hypothetical protein